MREHDGGYESDRPIESRTSTRQKEATVDGGVLSGLETTETMVDRVNVDRIAAELPGGWTAKPDLVQSDSDPLVETLLFRRSLSEPQLVLRPADPAQPGKNIEFYERSSPRTTSKRTMTVDRLPEAIRAAVNRIHQFDA